MTVFYLFLANISLVGLIRASSFLTLAKLSGSLGLSFFMQGSILVEFLVSLPEDSRWKVLEAKRATCLNLEENKLDFPYRCPLGTEQKGFHVNIQLLWGGFCSTSIAGTEVDTTGFSVGGKVVTRISVVEAFVESPVVGATVVEIDEVVSVDNSSKFQTRYGTKWI